MNQALSKAARSLQARGVAARKRKGPRKTARPEAIRAMMNVSQATHVLNAAVAGQPVKDVQLNAAKYVIDKFVPSLKAVAMQVSSTPSLKRADLEARMLSIGLDPVVFWQMIASNPENVPSNVIEHQPDSVPSD